ncbi:MAG: HtaA domain-containing protein [Corynebacterium sp.]|nr:HtaA domain-containing protein [Corynebacterium sp.]
MVRGSRLALAATVAAGLLAVPVAQAQSQPQSQSQEAGAAEITSGTFVWGIRKSLISYVEGPISRGQALAVEPAQTVSNGIYKEFEFPVQATTVDAQGNTTIPLAGGVHLQGHPSDSGYQLDLSFSDLKVLVTGQDAQLTGDFVTKGQVEAQGDDVTLVTFKLDEPIDTSAKQVDYNNLGTTAEQGLVDALLRYNVGESMDAAELHLNLNGTDDAKQYGQVTSLDDENRTKVLLGAVLGVVALIGGAIAAVWQFLPQWGIKLPF